jgi:hypothetical protein
MLALDVVHSKMARTGLQSLPRIEAQICPFEYTCGCTGTLYMASEEKDEGLPTGGL